MKKTHSFWASKDLDDTVTYLWPYDQKPKHVKDGTEWDGVNSISSMWDGEFEELFGFTLEENTCVEVKVTKPIRHE